MRLMANDIQINGFMRFYYKDSKTTCAKTSLRKKLEATGLSFLESRREVLIFVPMTRLKILASRDYFDLMLYEDCADLARLDDLIRKIPIVDICNLTGSKLKHAQIWYDSPNETILYYWNEDKWSHGSILMPRHV